VLEKLPTLKMLCVLVASPFGDFWGSAPIYNATSFKKFFKIPIGLFDD
jgi:hypothetical protein